MRHPHGEPSDLIRSVSRALRVLEAVGQTPRGLTVKQIARRCELTTATTYHLIRTLAYEGYVARREDGTYVVGLEIADRFRELVAAFRGPASVGDAMRRAVSGTGYSHYLGTFLGGQVVLASVAEGPQSPHTEDLVPGFDEGAHATALGKALLATLNHDQRLRYLKETGMRGYTGATFTQPEALEADLMAGERRGMQVEVSQFRPGLACAAVTVRTDPDPERRVVLACAMAADRLVDSANEIRTHLIGAARTVAAALDEAGGLVPA
ncbi:MAG TPA: helix-turn-helix domain-containing protein [Micromonosporaceae bacterium]